MQRSSAGRRQELRLKRKITIGTAVLLLLVLLIIAVAVRRGRNPQEKKALEQGTAYLESLEQRDVTAIAQDVTAPRKQARAEAIASGELPLWAQFESSLFFGDSRVADFSGYGFLSDSQVMAANGWTIRKLVQEKDAIVSRAPENLIIGLGSNDLQSNLGGSAQGYADEYLQAVQPIQEALPDTTIYICSILLANGKALSEQKYQALKNTASYNEALQAMCEKAGFHFVDLTSLCTEHPEAYEPDGVHFKKEFYPLWGEAVANMLEI